MRKGTFWWKKRWLSVCDIHDKYNVDCEMCNHGFWKNSWIHKVENNLLNFFPVIWKWWTYRKIDKKLKRHNDNIIY